MSTYELNIDAPEAFEFSAGGYTYRMRYANTEETLELGGMSDLEATKLLLSFISSASKDAPEFSELVKGKNQVIYARLIALYKQAAEKEL